MLSHPQTPLRRRSRAIFLLLLRSSSSSLRSTSPHTVMCQQKGQHSSDTQNIALDSDVTPSSHTPAHTMAPPNDDEHLTTAAMERLSLSTRSRPSFPSDPPPVPLSFPRSSYPDVESQLWPVAKDPMYYAARGQWSARLASRAWRQAVAAGDNEALSDPALFTGAVLDSALERLVPFDCVSDSRLHAVVRPSLADEPYHHFETWVYKTDEAIGDALDTVRSPSE